MIPKPVRNAVVKVKKEERTALACAVKKENNVASKEKLNGVVSQARLAELRSMIARTGINAKIIKQHARKTMRHVAVELKDVHAASLIKIAAVLRTKHGAVQREENVAKRKERVITNVQIIRQSVNLTQRKFVAALIQKHVLAAKLEEFAAMIRKITGAARVGQNVIKSKANA